jgi:hypothetical protein
VNFIIQEHLSIQIGEEPTERDKLFEYFLECNFLGYRILILSRHFLLPSIHKTYMLECVRVLICIFIYFSM